MSCAIILAVAVAWVGSEWIAVPNAPVAGEYEKALSIAAPGASWFVTEVENADTVVSARWTTTALGVYELYLNGENVGGQDALKPGYTHGRKTRRSFTYDVTPQLKTAKGAKNMLAAEVTGGWWRDAICYYVGSNSAFRGVLELTYANGATARYGTNAKDWKCAIGGPVQRAAIFDGEIYDARVAPPAFADATLKMPIGSTEFQGEILPSDGGEVCRRDDLALKPVAAYTWRGVTGAVTNQVYGKVVTAKTFDPRGTLQLAAGETLVIDFGQNCAAVPEFTFKAKPGVTLTCLPGEMLNDANGEKSRGNDGPGGSLYRANLRMPESGMRLVYTFATDKAERYMPRHTFFGYRYLSITATDAVTISSVRSIPVTSIAKAHETGKIETGHAGLNRLIANVYWGQLSNYLSVPTDCPQRNERQGWTADTQVFLEAGSYNADVRPFIHKWMRDIRDTQRKCGGIWGTAPDAGETDDGSLRFGWADACVIIPYRVWRHFGDTSIVRENWDAMARFLALVDRTKYDFTASEPYNSGFQWADWLSFEAYESCALNEKSGWRIDFEKPPAMRTYWNYLGACYWLDDAKMMADMATAIGKHDEAARYRAMAASAKAYLKNTFFTAADGGLPACLRGMQTPALFALHCGLVDGAAKEALVRDLRKNFAVHDNCLQTGFLGTSILLDTLTENGMIDIAYVLVLNHKFPSWLYSVDQGATTIWERWNSYTKERGFGPVGMNSFNHYAYGAVLAWIYKTAAGIASDPAVPGFKSIVMRPEPSRRLGHVTAEYQSAAGLIKSAWHYEGRTWIWEFEVPEGATARVTLPGETVEKVYPAGRHRVVR